MPCDATLVLAFDSFGHLLSSEDEEPRFSRLRPYVGVVEGESVTQEQLFATFSCMLMNGLWVCPKDEDIARRHPRPLTRQPPHV